MSTTSGSTPRARRWRIAAVPLAIALVGTAAAGRTTTILVKAGDTLSGIAKSHHTTVQVLQKLNHLPDPDVISVGQRLLIPAAAPRPTPVKTTPTATTTTSSTTTTTTKVVVKSYTVRSGDTLTAIAKSYGVSIAAIESRNHVPSSGIIFIGQQLKIAVTVTVTVKVPVKATAENSFAGRIYPPAVVAAANHNRAVLAARSQPSQGATHDLIVATAKKYGLDPALALAIGWQESGFQQRVVSPANAIGVMQVVPSTGDYISTYLVHRRLDLLKPADNVTAGVALLKALTESAPIDKAVAGYYQGLGSVLTQGMYADTKSYVTSVLRLRKHFAS